MYPWSGLSGMSNVDDDPTDRFRNVAEDLGKLHALHRESLSYMAPYFLERIKILNQSTSKRHRHSDVIESLRVGDILVDKNRVLHTGSAVSALCRVVRLSPDKRVALVVHLKSGMRNNPDFLSIGKAGVACKESHAQPCEQCDNRQYPNPCLEVLALETAQCYFVTHGPDNLEEDVPLTGHLGGPQIPKGGKRFVLPDPDCPRTAWPGIFGVSVPFMSGQDPRILNHEALKSPAWQAASPPADNESESASTQSTAPAAAANQAEAAADQNREESPLSSDDEAETPPEINITRTRAGRHIKPPSRLGF